MSHLDDEYMEEIKQKCDMIALCAHLGLKRMRGAKTFHCPRGENHAQGDAHASFVVHPLIRTFECLVCKDDPLTKMTGRWRGDCFELVMAIKKIGLPEAVAYVDEFNSKLEKERKERGFDGYSDERTELLHNVADTSMYTPMYSLIWASGKRVTEFPEVAAGFERMGISKSTLHQYNVVYLNDLEKVMKWLRDKYPNSESLIKAGILTYDGGLKFENYRIVIPFFEKDVITNLQGWDISDEKPIFINPKNDIPMLLNGNRLMRLRSGSTVIFTEDALECMSASELFAEPDVIPVAPGTRKINNEWLEYCHGMIVKTMMKDMEKAAEIAKIFENIKQREIEIVDPAREGGTSINTILCRKKGLI
ncbi:MAG: hypothetical protein ABII64_00565 [Elusimicrobiota bacterium]